MLIVGGIVVALLQVTATRRAGIATCLTEAQSSGHMPLYLSERVALPRWQRICVPSSHHRSHCRRRHWDWSLHHLCPFRWRHRASFSQQRGHSALAGGGRREHVGSAYGATTCKLDLNQRESGANIAVVSCVAEIRCAIGGGLVAICRFLGRPLVYLVKIEPLRSPTPSVSVLLARLVGLAAFLTMFLPSGPCTLVSRRARVSAEED